jgi:hypothetical protein
MTTTTAERVASALLGLEGVAVFVLAGWQVVALVTGDTDDAVSSVALVVLTTIGALALVAFAVAVFLGHSWGRSGGIVAQLLILAVALGAATGPTAVPATAVATAAPAVLALVALFTAVRRAAARRPPEER